jgi:hypothetical protein
MKGLPRIPSPKDLVKVYNRLQSERLTGRFLLSFFQWVRFDPRLGEIIVSKISQDWEGINPFYLHCHLAKTIWPSSMGVILDMAQLKIPAPKRTSYKVWKNCVQAELEPAPNEQFFIGLYAFAGAEIQKQVAHTNQIYQRWGYFGSDLFFNKSVSLKNQKTLLKKSDRLNILRELSAQKSVLSVSDYLNALPAPVSRRVAELDLQRSGLRAYGKTQSRIYKK